MEETAHLLVQLDGKVPEGDWLVDTVEYAVPDRQMHFHRVLSIPLGATALDYCRKTAE